MGRDQYDIFISFKNSDLKTGKKTEDSKLAKTLYDYLTSKGLKVFFSDIELEFLGQSQYTDAIDAALDSSRFLIAVGCRRENLESEWVKYEWRSFINDIRDGSKSNSEVFVLYKNMEVLNLPRALKERQAFDAQDSNSYERLYNFISNALGKSEKIDRDESASNRDIKEHSSKDVVVPNKSADELYSDGIKMYWEEKQYKLAFAYFQKAVALGHKWATTQLGHCYNHGNGVAQNDVEALKWYREGASNGDSLAKAWVANFYKRGRGGVPEDHVEAYRWYKEAAEQGNSSGYEGLGYAYAQGLGVTENLEEAEKCFRKAAVKGNKNAKEWLAKNGKADDIFYEGKIHYMSERYAEALPLFAKASELSHPEAEYNLGVMFLEGLGVVADIKEGTKRVINAAENGFAEAQYRLGEMYKNGIHVPKIQKEAVKWYEKAAEQGHLSAQKKLPWHYDNGIGTDKDEKRAFEWILKAAKQGHGDSCFWIGQRYHSGQGVSKDSTQAFEWYTKAVEYGNASGYNGLGILYFDGFGIAKDEKQAVSLFKEAAERNNSYGCYQMALMHKNGTGIEKDLVKAREYAEKSIALGGDYAKPVIEKINMMLANIPERETEVEELKKDIPFNKVAVSTDEEEKRVSQRLCRFCGGKLSVFKKMCKDCGESN